MVVAYLRGLLKPTLTYGLRSLLAEEAILEALEAQLAVEGYGNSIIADAAVLPALEHKSKEHTMRSIRARLMRCTELRTFDIYRLNRRVELDKNGISLYQLYQVASANGLMDALKDYGTK